MVDDVCAATGCGCSVLGVAGLAVFEGPVEDFALEVVAQPVEGVWDVEGARFGAFVVHLVNELDAGLE